MVVYVAVVMLARIGFDKAIMGAGCGTTSIAEDVEVGRVVEMVVEEAC